MDSVEDDEAFCSVSPSHIITSAPGKALSGDIKQKMQNAEDFRAEQHPSPSALALSLEERLAPLGQASEADDEMYFDGKWASW